MPDFSTKIKKLTLQSIHFNQSQTDNSDISILISFTKMSGKIKKIRIINKAAKQTIYKLTYKLVTGWKQKPKKKEVQYFLENPQLIHKLYIFQIFHTEAMQQSQRKQDLLITKLASAQVRPSIQPTQEFPSLQYYLSNFSQNLQSLSATRTLDLFKNNQFLDNYRRKLLSIPVVSFEKLQLKPLQNPSRKMTQDYCRAIFAFIERKSSFSCRLMKKLGLSKQQFKIYLKRQSQRVQSVQELQAFCYEQNNKFTKAFRIIMVQYSRKQRLADIFCYSKNDYNQHLLYRNKLIVCLSRSFGQGKKLEDSVVIDTSDAQF